MRDRTTGSQLPPALQIAAVTDQRLDARGFLRRDRHHVLARAIGQPAAAACVIE
jgi:hypothetical protein